MNKIDRQYEASLNDLAATGPRTVSILGSTGSIGVSTIDLIERFPDQFSCVALTANSNVADLALQAKRLNVQFAAVADPNRLHELKEALSGTPIKAGAGPNALVEAAEMSADVVVAAIVGAAGLAPTLAAVRRGAVVGLANKESLVCAGDLVLAEVERTGAKLLPIDSEHNAIYQVFDFEHPENIEKIILTASGGPFRQRERQSLQAVTVEEAVAHPTWSMGAKISVDSATMMNKGLEIIEAYHLFPVKEEQIEVLVHPQSVIHSMVAYVCGSVLAQLGSPDMRTPIAYALAWPERISTPCERLNLAKIGQLTFEAPDETRFPALRLARQALKAGGAAPTILNAANEEAVYAFLARKASFLGITGVVEEVLAKLNHDRIDNLEQVYEVDGAARRMAQSLIAKGV